MLYTGGQTHSWHVRSALVALAVGFITLPSEARAHDGALLLAIGLGAPFLAGLLLRAVIKRALWATAIGLVLAMVWGLQIQNIRLVSSDALVTLLAMPTIALLGFGLAAGMGKLLRLLLRR